MLVKVMISGHRSLEIGGYDSSNPVAQYVKQEIKNILIKIRKTYPNIEGISGMAIGSDTIFCHVCLELGIPFIAYVPFEGQECRWPQQTQDEYHDLLSKAKKIQIISDGHYSPKKMHLRNEAMANDSDFAIIVWNGKLNGGTYSCVKYLQRIQRTTFRINPNNR